MTDKSAEEMASEFIVRTCQLLPKSIYVVSDRMHDLVKSSSAAPKDYSILCGSAAEFYIRPLNICIGDVDYLSAKADELVFSGDFPVLPSDISGLADSINCCKIEPYYRYPGFVRLQSWGEMNYNWKYKKYEFRNTPHSNSYAMLKLDTHVDQYYLYRQEMRGKKTVTGPAIKTRGDVNREYYCGSDIVKSLWCPQWPKEAQGWLKRPRNNGWPTIRTISEVIQNGCHVVYVQHRACRYDKSQWRFSFSVAEVILIQSWTQIQQIVYHLLRFFAKRELIQKDCPKEDEVLCPYHLKTLMLWTCEEMSSEWWNSTSLITICCELLKKLAEWLKKRHCPNYFIPAANLFHDPSSSTIIDKTEKRLDIFQDSSSLCNWFVENYILQFIRKHINRTLKVMPHFVDFMLPLLAFWKANESKSMDFLFITTVAWSHANSRSAIKFGLSSGLRQCFKEGYSSRCLDWKVHGRLRALPAIQNVLCFTYYDMLLYILHIANGLGCGEISWDNSLFVEFVQAISTQPKIIKSQYHNFPKTYTTQSSLFQFLRAQDLMQNITGSNSRPVFQLLSLMSKEFLRRALEYEGSKSSDIAPAALAYLAALHLATSEYQAAISYCSAVLVDQTSQKDKETLNAGCLLFIDDIARIVGLCVLHKKITDNNLKYIGRRLYLDMRLSPEVFAYYLTALSVERISRRLDFHHGLPTSAFLMDEYLKALRKPKCIVSIKSGSRYNGATQIVYRRVDSLEKTEVTDMNPLIVKEAVIGALMGYALENMTSFISLIRKDFGIQCKTGDCYHALHLYKCRQYDAVLHLCCRILRESDLQSNLKEFSFANVLLLPPLDSFFDRDVQSLLGFHTLFYYLSPLSDNLRKCYLTADSTFAHWFPHIMAYKRDVLSCFLQCHYPIKRQYFLGRYFLARYLRVRCRIDCNLPYTEAMTEFAAQKANLPFEHIIRRFLLRKFRVKKNSSSRV